MGEGGRWAEAEAEAEAEVGKGGLAETSLSHISNIWTSASEL